MQIIDVIGQSLLTAAGMALQVLWSLVLGFTISGMIQAYVSRARLWSIIAPMRHLKKV